MGSYVYEYIHDKYVLLNSRYNQNGIYLEFLPSCKFRPFIKRYYFIEGFGAYSDLEIYSVANESIELSFFLIFSYEKVENIFRNFLIRFSKFCF